MIIRLKKIPIDSTWAEFWNVVFIPEPAPRCSRGRLFITAARLGDPNDAITSPVKNSRSANSQYGKLTGSSSSSTNATAVPIIPPVANGRAPNRSDKIPDNGPDDQEPDRQRQHRQPRPQRRAREVVAVQRQPDPLEPDDQHEHQPAAAQRRQEAGQRRPP